METIIESKRYKNYNKETKDAVLFYFDKFLNYKFSEPEKCRKKNEMDF